MSLRAGSTVGAYEIVGAIGAGGMGEVYRARDNKLNRDVAIKVLPAAFADDPERLARFTREAQTLASLNHPNIATIHGIEEVPAVGTGAASRALVMELVDGEDLSSHIARGPIPLAEALPMARQIAEALEAAHEQGIVHRDLKPANIKVRPDGAVKVLDFGLAKAMDPAGGSASNPNVSHSPTLTHQGTSAGVIIGTAAYMSPEQARGRAVDKRADIWAFGVVLFEMLTGARLFKGETVSDTLAAVLTADPDWKRLPAGTPASVERLIRRCLDRDVKHRLQAIGEARIVLADTKDDATARGSGPAPGSLARLAPWAIAALSLAAVGWMLQRPASRTAAVPTHVDLAFPTEIEPLTSLDAGFAISPDGRAVIMTGVTAGGRRVFIRHLQSDETMEINDPTGINGSGFSPDSRSIVYRSTAGPLVTFNLADQQRKLIGNSADLFGGLPWGASGVVFSRKGELWLAPVDGGAERQVTKLDQARQETLHANPTFLPDGRLLFVSLTVEAGDERIEAVSLEDGQRTVVLERANTPLYSPTGHLLFSRDGALMAGAFDPVSLKLVGTAVTLMPKGELAWTQSGGLQVSLSANGDLAVIRERYQTTRVDLVERDGSARNVPFPRARYLNPRLSPDGRRIMVEASGLRLDAFDLERQTLTRLTREAPGTTWPTWNRDGTAAFFRRNAAPYWVATDGTGKEGRVPGGGANDYLSGAGPDPDSFLCVRITPTASGDLTLISRTGAFEPRALIATPAYEGGGQLSPDGRWLVYVSNESGQFEVQVRRYPSLERKWLVSGGFGGQPRWRADGREISYRDGKNMLAVPFDGSKEEPVVGKPEVLFKDEYDFGLGLTTANYDRTRDGRFIMLRRDTRGISMSLVLNWAEELKEIMARGGTR